MLARRAGWQDLSQEGMCLTATSAAACRLDHLWVSPALAGRSSAAEVSWAEGLPTHAVHSWKVLAEVPGRLDHWQVADPGPEEGEGSFTDQEWRDRFNIHGDQWMELSRNQDVDGMWNMLEESLVSCPKIRAANFRQPKGKVVNKCEEPAHNAYTGAVETEATIAATTFPSQSYEKKNEWNCSKTTPILYRQSSPFITVDTYPQSIINIRLTNPDKKITKYKPNKKR